MGEKIVDKANRDIFPAVVLLKLGDHILAERTATEISKMQCHGEAFCFLYNGDTITGKIYSGGERESVTVAPAADMATNPSSVMVCDLGNTEVTMCFKDDQMVCSVAPAGSHCDPVAMESGNLNTSFIIVPAARVEGTLPMNLVKLADTDLAHVLAKEISKNHGWAAITDVGNGQYKRTLYVNGNLFESGEDKITQQLKLTALTFPAGTASSPKPTEQLLREVFLH